MYLVVLFFILSISLCQETVKGKVDFDDKLVCSDDIPDYLSYGHYEDKNISEAELREKIDPRIIHNCKYCGYPQYDLNFHHENEIYTFSDAFTSGNGEYISLLVNIPYKKDSVIENYTMKGEDYENAILEVHPKAFCEDGFFSSSTPISLEVEYVYFHEYYMVMTFSLENNKELLESCFYVFLKDKESGHEFIEKPILVRHCHEEKKAVKRDKLSMCTMVHNPDRWMVEWIEWHRMMGVSHFYLYMHQHEIYGDTEGYYDTTFSLLDNYVKEGIVSIFLWNYTRDGETSEWDLNAAVNDCLWRFRDVTKYLIILDDKEFVVPLDDDDVLSVLEKKEPEMRDNLFAAYGLIIFDFEEDRTPTSHLNTISYRRAQDPKILNYLDLNKKMILITDRAAIVSDRFVKVSTDGYLPVQNRKVKKENILIDLFLANYKHRDFHESNRLIGDLEEFEQDHEDEECAWVVARVQDFSEELERRVEEMEEQLDVARYEYEYNVFETSEEDEVEFPSLYIDSNEHKKETVREKKEKEMFEIRRRVGMERELEMRSSLNSFEKVGSPSFDAELVMRRERMKHKVDEGLLMEEIKKLREEELRLKRERMRQRLEEGKILEEIKKLKVEEKKLKEKEKDAKEEKVKKSSDNKEEENKRKRGVLRTLEREEDRRRQEQEKKKQQEQLALVRRQKKRERDAEVRRQKQEKAKMRWEEREEEKKRVQLQENRQRWAELKDRWERKFDLQEGDEL